MENINNIEVYMVGRDSRYKAQGKYKNGKITVNKGSTISPEVSITMKAKIAVLARNNKTFVDESYVVLQDIEMSSPSIAAQFVSGQRCNGMLRWRVSKHQTLKDFLENKICQES